MPIKLGRKRYKSFGTATASLQKKGYSAESAKKIVGSIEAKQRKKHSKKK